MHNGYHRMCQETRQEHRQIAVINLGCNKMDKEKVRETVENERGKGNESNYEKGVHRSKLNVKVSEQVR